MKQLAEEKNRSIYIQLEVREGDTAEGKLIEAWEMDASRFVKVPRDWNARVIVEDYIVTPTPSPTAKPSGTVSPSPTESVSPTPTQDVTGSVTPTTDPSELQLVYEIGRKTAQKKLPEIRAFYGLSEDAPS